MSEGRMGVLVQLKKVSLDLKQALARSAIEAAHMPATARFRTAWPVKAHEAVIRRVAL